ncbi:hypothetical protein PIB30_032534 [Stylosanthes scabra]|uniref:Uncharacterized protein n=1 Tax=Stylosanthes scabra TaxID=79078 RepID=A0ABU6YB24_9FABA|nr:hypothetical protein [Stylosanthes scabra]
MFGLGQAKSKTRSHTHPHNCLSHPPPTRFPLPHTLPSSVHPFPRHAFAPTLTLHPSLSRPPPTFGMMASSPDASRKRRGKAVVVDEDTFDAHRFKTPFHEHFFNSNVASKPIIPDARFNLEEDQYPQIRQQIELRG